MQNKNRLSQSFLSFLLHYFSYDLCKSESVFFSSNTLYETFSYITTILMLAPNTQNAYKHAYQYGKCIHECFCYTRQYVTAAFTASSNISSTT